MCMCIPEKNGKWGGKNEKKMRKIYINKQINFEKKIMD